jgi:hypothetical protein
MTEQSFKEKLDERITRRSFASALEACERLPSAAQERLLKDIARQILHRIEAIRSEAANVVGIDIK